MTKEIDTYVKIVMLNKKSCLHTSLCSGSKS